MGGSSPAGATTTTQTATPGNSSYQNFGLQQAQNMYNNGQSTYVGMNPAQTDAANRLINMGSQGSTVVPAAIDQAQNTMSGQYLNANPASAGYNAIINGGQNGLQATASGQYLNPNSNPWLSGTYDQAFGKVQNAVGSAMAGAGRFGSGAMAGALTDGAGNLANNLYGSAYQNERNLMNGAQQAMTQNQLSANNGLSTAFMNERGNMMNATQMAPALESARYIPAQMEAAGGQMFQQNDQNALNAQYDKLNRYLGAVGGMPNGGTTTMSTPYFQNGTANALGTGLGLAGIAGAIPSSVYGALGGALKSGGSALSDWLSGNGGAGSIGANNSGQFTMSNGQVDPNAVGYANTGSYADPGASTNYIP